MSDQPAEPLFDESPASVAREVAQEMLDAGSLSATAVVVAETEESVDIALEGDDAGLLVGKQGQTLNAFQYLLGLIASRRLNRRYRISVDAEGFRAKRAASLIEAARSLADQVRAAGEEAVMDPLNAAERRIVHTALVDEPGITTYSEGEEPNRRVVISPKA